MNHSVYLKAGLMAIIFHGLLLAIGIVFSAIAVNVPLHTLSSSWMIEIDPIISLKNDVLMPSFGISTDPLPTHIEGSNEEISYKVEENPVGIFHDASTHMPSAEVLALNNPHPPYPISSRENGEQGRVILNACISELGMVDYVELVNGSGYGALDRSAINTVRRWQFIAAKRFGIPIPMCYRLPINFILAN